MTSNNDSKTTAAADVSPSSSYLRQDQIQTFLRDGILVVENVLSPDELANAKNGLETSLKQNHHVDITNRLHETGHAISKLSSTNGSGGVLDIFYESWKLDIALHPKLFTITTELWKVAYDDNDNKEQQSLCFKWHHQYGDFDYTKGYMYLDRIGYRLPTILAEELGNVVVSNNNNGQRNNNNNKKKKKTIPIQRSLTPHLDCCPETFYDIQPSSKAGQKQKWRPIQCFVSLSDTKEAQNGGFEAVRGFHHDFAEWAAHRPPTTVTSKKKAGTTTRTKNIIIPAPCIGEYTYIRPKEDKEIMDRIEHIPVSAGSAVFWDNRIPHANSYRHLGTIPRAVVYCSFLPDVPVNRRYVARQLQAWKDGRHPTDQWINPTTTTNSDTDNNGEKRRKDAALACLEKVATTPLARHLVGLEPWDG